MKFGCSDGEKGEVLPPYQHWMFDRFQSHVCDGRGSLVHGHDHRPAPLRIGMFRGITVYVCH